MDLARLARSDVDLDARPQRSRDEGTPLSDFERVLRFPAPGRAGELDGLSRDRGGPTARDVTQVLDLVREASLRIRSGEDKARENEARMHALLQRAAEELKASEARTQAAEARTRTMEARAQEAETRAKDAEDWLRQIFATVSEELPQGR